MSLLDWLPGRKANPGYCISCDGLLTGAEIKELSAICYSCLSKQEGRQITRASLSPRASLSDSFSGSASGTFSSSPSMSPSISASISPSASMSYSQSW